MIETNDEMRLREAVDLLRRAEWPSEARLLQNAELTPGDVLRHMRNWFSNRGADQSEADAAAIAALEAIACAPASDVLAQATSALAEARAKCDELRDVIAAQEAEREAMCDEIEEVRRDLREAQGRANAPPKPATARAGAASDGAALAIPRGLRTNDLERAPPL